MKNKIVYSLNVEDIQTVAEQELNREGVNQRWNKKNRRRAWRQNQLVWSNSWFYQRDNRAI